MLWGRHLHEQAMCSKGQAQLMTSLTRHRFLRFACDLQLLIAARSLSTGGEFQGGAPILRHLNNTAWLSVLWAYHRDRHSSEESVKVPNGCRQASHRILHRQRCWGLSNLPEAIQLGNGKGLSHPTPLGPIASFYCNQLCQTSCTDRRVATCEEGVCSC